MELTVALTLAAATLLLICASQASLACADFTVKAADGSIANGRTLEFGVDMPGQLLITPRGLAVQSKAPSGSPGVKWTGKYGYFGINAFGLPVTIDGVNEKGLSLGALWLPDYTQYESIGPGEEPTALALTDFDNWILANFATVEEVRSALANVSVWGDKVPQLDNSTPPLHLAVHDTSGKSIVIEFVGGSKQVYDNLVHAMTNAPPFPWHLTNLRNYLQLSPLNPESKTIGGAVYQSPGHGAGMLGIPGDWSPPSRFVRLCAMLAFSKQTADAKSAVNLAQHIVNAMDIPMGLIREDSANGVLYDYTRWSLVKDLGNLVIYFRGYGDSGFKAYPLSDYDIKQGSRQTSVSLQ